MDFLEHEMAEAALISHVIAAAQLGGGPLLAFAGAVIQLNTQGAQEGHLPILKGQDCAGNSS